MHLWIHLDASYLNGPKNSSHNGGSFQIWDKTKIPINTNDPPPKLNATVIVNRKITETVMSSAKESETGSGFINGKDYVTLRNTLH